MEIITDGVTIIKNFVVVIGAAMAIIGGIQFFQGQGDNNAAQKQVGMNLFIGGAGIVAIALTLIPKLSTLMTV